MKTKIVKKILRLYPEFHSVYGPYKRKDGRKILILYDGRRRSARQLARVKLEVHLGRRLRKNEEVDHRDNDFTNDKIGNLQVLSKSDNARKSAIRLKSRQPKSTCLWCAKKFVLTRNQYTSRARKTAGPFCSRTCCGKYAQSVQLTGQKLKSGKRKVAYI